MFDFKGTKWQSVNDRFRQLYLKNAYRVVLTRARQGMVIFVPRGDEKDPTRLPHFYDATFDYLKSFGLREISVDTGKSSEASNVSAPALFE